MDGVYGKTGYQERSAVSPHPSLEGCIVKIHCSASNLKSVRQYSCEQIVNAVIVPS